MQRRSAISNCNSISGLIGNTPIPSGLGQTITGAIVNLNSRSSGGTWELIKAFNETATISVTLRNYSEFMLSTLYTPDNWYYNSAFIPLACIEMGYTSWSSQMAQNASNFPYTTATFNLSNNTVTVVGYSGILMGCLTD